MKKERRRNLSWVLAYNARIEAGLEYCRFIVSDKILRPAYALRKSHCSSTCGLQISRLLPDSNLAAMSGVTILCRTHASQFYVKKGDFAEWRRGLSSLLEEERAAPPDERWGLIAIEEARASSGLLWGWCPRCRRIVQVWEDTNRLKRHSKSAQFKGHSFGPGGRGVCPGTGLVAGDNVYDSFNVKGD